MNAATSRQTDLIPRVATSCRHRATRTTSARKRSRQFSFCALHIVVSQHMSYPPSHFGYTHSSVINMLRSSILYSRRHFARVHDGRFTLFRHAQLRCILRSRVVLGVLLSPHCVICPMDFSVPQRKHRVCGTRPSYACRQHDSCLISTAALHEVHRLARHGIYVGEGADGWMWAGPQCSTLVLGPPRSGKTSSLVIPNILLSEGPVVSTSTKPDVMRATAPSRASRRVVVPLRPERRGGMPTGCRARRLVAPHDRRPIGTRRW